MRTVIASLCGVAVLLAGLPAGADEYVVLGHTDIARVWSGHPVGFAMRTTGERQYVAFYDGDRRMTVAQRDLADGDWDYKVLPERVGWDSHNRVVLTQDSAGYLHLWGNMHVDPLVYFRSEKPDDATTLVRVNAMVGTEEDRMTYPQVVPTADGSLVFTYRDGSSGSGNQIYNRYDIASRTWSRLLDQPLTDGNGEMNAYFNGPLLGPDGRYHVCWVWRNTPDCETNHTIMYARSTDLVHWERSDGTPLSLPITFASGEVVDPAKPGGGLINGNVKLGFSGEEVFISYHKYDEAGQSQVFVARLEEGRWVSHQVSDWDFRWAFQGRGSIGFEVQVLGVRPNEEGLLTLRWSAKERGSGAWLLDPETLAPVGTAPKGPSLPAELTAVESTFPGMSVRRLSNGVRRGDIVEYQLKWETLGSNRDRAREGDIPPPSVLRLYSLGIAG